MLYLKYSILNMGHKPSQMLINMVYKCCWIASYMFCMSFKVYLGTRDMLYIHKEQKKRPLRL